MLYIVPQYEVRVGQIYFEDEDWDNAAEHYGSSPLPNPFCKHSNTVTRLDRAALYCRKTVSLVSGIPWSLKVEHHATGSCRDFS